MDIATGLFAAGRALLALQRTQASGTLELYVRGMTPRAVSLLLLRGRLVAARPAGAAAEEELVDGLIARGELELERFARVCATRSLFEPMATFLLRSGLCEPVSVAQRVRAQLVACAAATLLRPGTEYRFVAGRPAASRETTAELRDRIGVCLSQVVIEALRRAQASGLLAQLRSPLPTGDLELSSAGRMLLATTTLQGDEMQLLSALASGTVRGDSVRAASEQSALWLVGLHALGAVRGAAQCAGTPSLLLRKRQQLRRGDSDRALLGLPQGADERAARRALRELASALHPDRMTRSYRELVPTSNEILRELLSAERRLAAAATR